MQVSNLLFHLKSSWPKKITLRSYGEFEAVAQELGLECKGQNRYSSGNRHMLVVTTELPEYEGFCYVKLGNECKVGW